METPDSPSMQHFGVESFSITNSEGTDVVLVPRIAGLVGSISEVI